MFRVNGNETRSSPMAALSGDSFSPPPCLISPMTPSVQARIEIRQVRMVSGKLPGIDRGFPQNELRGQGRQIESTVDCEPKIAGISRIDFYDLVPAISLIVFKLDLGHASPSPLFKKRKHLGNKIARCSTTACRGQAATSWPLTQFTGRECSDEAGRR